MDKKIDKEELEDKAEAVEKAATGLGVALSKMIGKIPFISAFQKAAIAAGGKNVSAEIRKKKPHGPHK